MVTLEDYLVKQLSLRRREPVLPQVQSEPDFRKQLPSSPGEVVVEEFALAGVVDIKDSSIRLAIRNYYYHEIEGAPWRWYRAQVARLHIIPVASTADLLFGNREKTHEVFFNHNSNSISVKIVEYLASLG